VNKIQSLLFAQNQLAELVQRASKKFEAPAKLNISPWLAMSVMQKAIRRGCEQFALQAASTLIELYPERFWRRLPIIAFEDIGIADIEAVSLVTAALKGKRWRKTISDEKTIGLFLVQQLSAANKCRSAADLAFICDWHPALETARQDLSSEPMSKRLQRLEGDAPLPERGLALWYAIGTERCSSPVLPRILGDREATYNRLVQLGYSEALIEIAFEGLRKCSEILPAFLPLLNGGIRFSATQISDDDFPEETLIGEIPSWAYDAHVREGNKALALFLKSNCQTASWVNAHVPKGRVQLLGRILFRIESGLCANRLRWATGDQLRHMADVECPAVRHENAAQLMEMLRSDIAILNDARAKVAGSNAR